VPIIYILYLTLIFLHFSANMANMSKLLLFFTKDWCRFSCSWRTRWSWFQGRFQVFWAFEEGGCCEWLCKVQNHTRATAVSPHLFSARWVIAGFIFSFGICLFTRVI